MMGLGDRSRVTLEILGQSSSDLERRRRGHESRS
jgi:hypothetical protein